MMPSGVSSDKPSNKKYWLIRPRYTVSVVCTLLLVLGLGLIYFNFFWTPGWLKTLSGHGGEVSSITFSPDGRTLATADTDGVVILWDLASGQERSTLKGHAS